jgi:hypothetical protein
VPVVRQVGLNLVIRKTKLEAALKTPEVETITETDLEELRERKHNELEKL